MGRYMEASCNKALVGREGGVDRGIRGTCAMHTTAQMDAYIDTVVMKRKEPSGGLGEEAVVVERLWPPPGSGVRHPIARDDPWTRHPRAAEPGWHQVATGDAIGAEGGPGGDAQYIV